VECGSVSVRNRPYVLGARRDRPLDTRMVGFGVHRGSWTGGAVLDVQFARRRPVLPTYLSADHDSAVPFIMQAHFADPKHRDIKTVPYVALPSCRRTTDWDRAARMPGSSAVLDRADSRPDTGEFQQYTTSIARTRGGTGARRRDLDTPAANCESPAYRWRACLIADRVRRRLAWAPGVSRLGAGGRRLPRGAMLVVVLLELAPCPVEIAAVQHSRRSRHSRRTVPISRSTTGWERGTYGTV